MAWFRSARSPMSKATGAASALTLPRTGARTTPPPAAKEVTPSRSCSTAWRKLTPRSFITQSIGPPRAPQPKQCHRFLAGVTTSEAVSSSWNGHRPILSSPDFFSSMLEASTRRSTLISFFSRSIAVSGMRAIGGLR